ncbi:hypothetical protein EDB92DRAFT_2028444 [Lactarius akahatsu]|uniref:Uncharacterized protein n=1 Tax=Lactarius akahatsu TaxID=416441 RepID=A0AAD4L9F4_9AGAM|nr:hypothetical protein EDB92DRAFT_2028444 [Lactarius akahatsu]
MATAATATTAPASRLRGALSPTAPPVFAAEPAARVGINGCSWRLGVTACVSPEVGVGASRMDNGSPVDQIPVGDAWGRNDGEDLSGCVPREVESRECLEAVQAGPEGIKVRLCAFARSDTIASLWCRRHKNEQRCLNEDSEKKKSPPTHKLSEGRTPRLSKCDEGCGNCSEEKYALHHRETKGRASIARARALSRNARRWEDQCIYLWVTENKGEKRARICEIFPYVALNMTLAVESGVVAYRYDRAMRLARFSAMEVQPRLERAPSTRTAPEKSLSENVNRFTVSFKHESVGFDPTPSNSLEILVRDQRDEWQKCPYECLRESRNPLSRLPGGSLWKRDLLMREIFRKAKVTHRLRGSISINHGTAFKLARNLNVRRGSKVSRPLPVPSKQNVVVSADTVNLILLLLVILAGWRDIISRTQRDRNACVHLRDAILLRLSRNGHWLATLM